MARLNIRQQLTFADKVLIGCLILVSLVSYPFVRYMTKEGHAVQIETDGTPYKTVALHQDQTFLVPGPLGDTIVVVEVKSRYFLICSMSVDVRFFRTIYIFSIHFLSEKTAAISIKIINSQ